MKNYLKNCAIASSILLTAPAFAQESGTQLKSGSPVTDATQTVTATAATTAQPEPPVKPTPGPENEIVKMQNSALWQVFVAVNKDVQPFFGRNADSKKAIEHLDRFQFSTETKEKLRELTGNDNPLHLKTTKLRNGNTELSIDTDEVNFKDPKTGASGQVAELTGKAIFDKGLNKINYVAALPMFHYESADAMQFTAGDLSVASDQARGPFGVWVGTGTIKLGQMTIDDSASKLHVMFDSLTAKTDVKPHGNFIDVGYDSAIKSIAWESDRVSQIHVAIRIVNLYAKDIAAIQEKAKKLNRSKPSLEESMLFSQSILKDFALSMNHGGAIEIQDVSATYHDMTAGLNGRIAFKTARDSDLESSETFAKKLDLRINLHIPIGWITDISRAVVRKSLEAKNKSGQPVNDAKVDAAAKSLTKTEMDEFLKKKWIRLEQDTMLSTIEFKMGKLFINGQAADLPSKPASAQAIKPKDLRRDSGVNGAGRQ